MRSAETAGIFTFNAVPFFRLFAVINLIISLLKRAAKVKSGFFRVLSDMAADLTPKNAPSVAAETVPEYRTLTPTLEPRFIPEIMISGCPCNSSCTAIFTQSAGVPLTPNPKNDPFL